MFRLYQKKLLMKCIHVEKDHILLNVSWKISSKMNEIFKHGIIHWIINFSFRFNGKITLGNSPWWYVIIAIYSASACIIFQSLNRYLVNLEMMPNISGWKLSFSQSSHRVSNESSTRRYIRNGLNASLVFWRYSAVAVEGITSFKEITGHKRTIKVKPCSNLVTVMRVHRNEPRLVCKIFICFGRTEPVQLHWGYVHLSPQSPLCRTPSFSLPANFCTDYPR